MRILIATSALALFGIFGCARSEAEPKRPTPTTVGTIGIGGTSVIIEAPVAVGSLANEEIQRIVRQNAERFRWCYESALEKNPKLAGKVKTMFTIGASGAITKAKSTSNMQSGELVRCIEQSFLSLTLPEPHGGGLVMVSQSLVFAPEAP